MTDKEFYSETEIIIVGDNVRHIKNVLRLKVGDSITICDGKENEYIVDIEKIEKESIKTSIKYRNSSITEKQPQILLYQAVPKADKMDLIIQKSVELGINKVIPVFTDRTIVNMRNDKDIQKKILRWQRISLEASKQSGRGIIPEISKPVTFYKALELMNNNDRKFILYEKESFINLKKYIINENIIKLEKENTISFIVGPEGGFTDNEVNDAKMKNIKSVSLGKRILRTETVALVVLSIIIYEIGDVYNE